MLSTTAIDAVYRVPNTEALALSTTDASGKKIYRKELIYEGAFVKRNAKQNIEFSVNKALLQHWDKTHKQFAQNGIEVPLPLAHIEDEKELENPLNRRATLIGTELAKNAKGLDALYGLITFHNPEDERLALSSDVSIYVPGEFTDGKGNTYYRPIRHVCFTDYPVIPGLEKFQAIAASLADDLNTKDENTMAKIDAKNLAKLLKVNPDLNDAAMETALETAIQELLEKAKKADEPEEVEEEEPIAAAFVTIAKDSRNQKLDNLVEKAIITPAVRDELKKVFTEDKPLSLSLSLSDDKKTIVERDSFSKVIEALAKNDPVSLKEQTKQQTLSLSHPNKDEANPILADAKRRAEEAQAKSWTS